MRNHSYFLVTGFFLGVVFRSFFDFGWAVVGLCVLFCLAFSVLKNWHIVILCLGMCFGVARYELKDNLPVAPIGDKAVIVDEPDQRENSVQYTVETRGRTFGFDPQGPTSRIKILVVAHLEDKFDYGDRVSIQGKILPVSDTYLTKDEIYFKSLFPTITLVEHGQGNWFRARLFDLKHAFLDRLARQIPEPESSLAGGLDLGAKQSLGKDLLDKFRMAGLIHMVVLSGYNITIVAIGVMWLFKKFLSLKWSIALGVLAIVLFALMTGGGSTVLRASVMAVMGLLAQATGRVNIIARALLIAALVMVAINPKVLVFDTGFQLSFLATLGLIYLEPIFAPYFRRLPEKILWMDFRSIASTTIAAQCAVFPLILYTFGNFSVYAFPVNMLVLPLVPTTMLFVFLAGLIGLFVIPLALPFAWIAYVFLAYMVGLVTLVSRLPLASLTFSHVPILFVLMIYVTLIYFVLKFHKKEQHLESRTPSA